ncbi:MAG: carbohydrate ABC transporter permease [Armatimonadetes bacterium]|nr:carbohydrate ABC transporter permease [Armatimonadota bacterium]
MKMRRRRRAADVITYALLTLILGFFLFPIVWLLLTSLKPARDAFAIPPVWVFRPILDNFRNVFAMVPVAAYLKNSLTIALGTTALSLVLGVPAGYGLARTMSRAAGNSALLMLAIRMAPPVALLIPFYLVMRDMRLLGTYLAVILLQSVFNTTFVTWMMRGYFHSLPADLELAALTDGCTRFGAFWRVALPLAVPGVATAAIFTFTFSWNDFLLPMLLSGRTTRTLTLGILETMSTYEIGWNNMAAIGMITVLPVLLLGYILQPYYVRGLTLGAVRE